MKQQCHTLHGNKTATGVGEDIEENIVGVTIQTGDDTSSSDDLSVGNGLIPRMELTDVMEMKW